MSRQILDGLLACEERYERRGAARMSEWWEGEAERFYLHPSAREWTAGVGRGGLKTGMIVRTSIAETIYGDFDIRPGERHYFAIVSATVPEATKTLRIVDAYLGFLGVRTETTADTIEIVGQPRGIKVLAARIGAVSGFRCFGWAADENAKWSSDGVNPSAEVTASMRAMGINHPTTRGRRFSSFVGRTGDFYESFAKGNTDHQIVSHAPTWIANPSVTEQQTRETEPDERVWKREYLAEAQSTALAAFDADAVERAFEPKPKLTPRKRALIIDPSSGRKDAWTWGVAGWNLDDSDRGYLSFDAVDGVEGSFWKQTSAEEIVNALALLKTECGITEVHSDQREAYALASLFERKGMTLHVHEWTASSKPRAVETVKRWFADGLLWLPKEPAKLRQECLDFEEKITVNGTFKYEARGSGHDDFVALLITAAMAELSGDLAHGSELPAFDNFLALNERPGWRLRV